MEGAALMKETMRGVGAYTSSYRDAELRSKTGVSTSKAQVNSFELEKSYTKNG